eukprot:TRINITY_DN10068_c0_g1_i6.p1 TRINITY_DN10068_c0_g1~~TRINITY_DN10068_c0_g1_i6.p1  ORF type:complete len:231 (+),score=14.07 TRINITY_DN10068_c0_g1_i6:363-1055(+)
MQEEDSIETLYYVPMNVKMILDIKGESCKINNTEIKTVHSNTSRIGRNNRKTREKANKRWKHDCVHGECQYWIYCCYCLPVFTQRFRVQVVLCQTGRQFDYVRVHGEIVLKKTGNEIKANLMANVTDHNEVTNHWLYVMTTHCIRKYGPLSEEELRSVEAGQKHEGATENEDLIVSAIKTIRAKGSKPQRDEIHDLVSNKIKYADFLKVVEGMVERQVLVTTDKVHYDLP